MPHYLSLTDFVDIVSTSGTSKLNKVLHIKKRPAYQPAFDFYKPLREQIISTHKKNASKNNIRRVLTILTDSKKINTYPTLINSYISWCGRKNFQWFDPPNNLYKFLDVDISVNPELGLNINGTPHLVKLYFKAEELSKSRVDVITHLMYERLSSQCPSNTVMSVLDIRSRKLFHPTVPINDLTLMLDGEIAFVSHVLNSA